MRLPWQRLMGYRVSNFGATGANNVTAFRQDQVRVRLSPSFNRRAHPDAALEATVDAVWQTYKAQSPRLFNATKFRLHSWHIEQQSTVTSSSPPAAPKPTLVLNWGLTDYKTYLGTCCSTHARRFVTDSNALLATTNASDRFAYLSRKVGVAAVVETADAHIALIKRSNAVGVYQNMLDTPGGHPEPSHVGITSESFAALCERDKSVPDAPTALEHAVCDALFASIATEVYEEINVDASAYKAPPLLLGVVFQADAQTPSFAFYMQTALTAAQVHELYIKGPSDAFESTQLVFVNAQQLLLETDDAITAALGDQLTPSARGSLELWRQYVRQNSNNKSNKQL